MDNNWEAKLLQASERLNTKQEEEFSRLVGQAFGHCSLDVARVLMKTFSDKPDYGTQEHVNAALATADREIAIQAILEELPRLIQEAPEWADCLIAQEVNFRAELLEKIALQMPKDIQLIIRDILNNEDVIDSNSQAKHLKDKLPSS